MISKRLLKIAEFIDKDETVYDVGTDHALLPCFLVKEGICQKVYASDNKEGPLANARENIVLNKLQDNIIPVLADGLDKCPIDVNVVTISGIGFLTVESIFDRADLNQFKKIIVQVNKDTKYLREYISKHNYTILKEEIVYDDFYYEIVSFNTKYHDSYSELENEYGPLNLMNKKPEFIDYIRFKINKYTKINQPKYDKKIEELKSILDYNY